MKKFLLSVFVIVLASGISVYADENYKLQQYENASNSITPQYIASTNPKTCTDYIKVPHQQSQISRIAMLNMIANDPYVVKIDDKKYYMVKTAPRGNYSVKNILGYHDDNTNIFKSLSALEKDGDTTKLTRAELQNAKIRFVLLKPDGKLALSDTSTDFDMKRVEYIDMKTLRRTYNLGNVGTFGYFDLYYKDLDGSLKRAAGLVTNEKDDELKALI